MLGKFQFGIDDWMLWVFTYAISNYLYSMSDFIIEANQLQIHGASSIYGFLVAIWVNLFDDVPVIEKTLLTIFYIVFSWNVGIITCLCIAAPNLGSIFAVPFGLFLYFVSVYVVLEEKA